MARPNVNRQVLAEFEFATVEKKDCAGNIRYETETSVNEPLRIRPDGYDQIRVGQHHKVTVTEEEVKNCDGNKLYTKDVNVHQSQVEGARPGFSGSNGFNAPQGSNGNNQPSENKDGLTPLQVLKNFVDQFHSDYSRDRTAQWVMIAVGVAVGLTGMVLGIIALS